MSYTRELNLDGSYTYYTCNQGRLHVLDPETKKFKMCEKGRTIDYYDTFIDTITEEEFKHAAGLDKEIYDDDFNNALLAWENDNDGMSVCGKLEPWKKFRKRLRAWQREHPDYVKKEKYYSDFVREYYQKKSDK